jgi:hypothetical protein
MPDIQHIDASDATTLCSDGRRLYLLSRQTDSEPIEDVMGRERRRTTLHAVELDSDEQTEWARDLPPSDSLAACDDAAYLWGMDRQSLVRVTADGSTETVAEFDNAAEGGLACAGSRLYYLGRTRPRQMGVAVFDAQLGDFAQVVNLDDPTHVAIQRMHVTEDDVWSLQHETRGWMMHRYPHDGETTEDVLTDEKLVLRWMTRTDDWIAAGGTDGVHLFLGDEHTFCETDVPPDDLVVVDGGVAWVQGGMTNEAGELVEPWRVLHLKPGDEAPDTLLETENRIATLVGGDWGCAALTQDTSGGLDQLLEGDVRTGVMVARR